MSLPDLTRFPNLHPSSSICEGPDAYAEQAIGKIQVPREVLLISWAVLLGYYIGDDQVVYLADDEIVKVNVTDHRVVGTSHDHLRGLSKGNYTGIFSTQDSKLRYEPAVYLVHDPEKEEAYLGTCGHVPVSHLPQLALQLRGAICQTERVRGQTTAISDGPKPALSVLNPSARFLSGPQLLHQLVALDKCGRNCAVDFTDRNGVRTRTSYASFDDMSSKLAKRLRRLLAGHGSQQRPVIPVLIPQSTGLYIALMGILKAGVAFCPLNLDAPEERVKFILQDVSASVVITTSALQARIPREAEIKVILIDDQQEEEDSQTVTVDPSPQPTDLAYVMYTSGSTGTPKGVGISHLAVTQSLLAHDPDIPKFSRFLQFAAPTFDVSVFEIFFPLYRGATLVSCDRNSMLNDLPSIMNKLQVDAAELTPTVAGSLLQRREKVPGLKLLLTIGEMLTPAVVEEFGGTASSSSILWGMYGPTECAIHCTLQPAFRSDSKVGNIGQPLGTVSAFILAPRSSSSPRSAEIEVLPISQVGELALGGHQLASGYLNRPEQTTAAFVDTKAFGRLYRTGDKARVLPDGSIECLGRIESGQVKLRGQRIELGEVEQAVCKAPGARNATAVVIGGTLVTFCLVNEGTSTDTILESCRRWLPAFMVPGDIVPLAGLPHLPSGKVDREQLRIDYEQSRTIYSRFDDNMDTKDRKVYEAIQNVLGRSINASTNLAAAGLDSLLAIRLASALRRFGFSANAIELLDAENGRELCSLVTRESSRSEPGSHQADNRHQELFIELRQSLMKSSMLSTIHTEITDIIGCTPLQCAMLAELERNSRAYCNWIELEFPPPSTFDSVKRAITVLAAQNTILRSGFCSTDDGDYPYAQIIWEDLEDDQFTAVEEFSREYTLNTTEALLRPLRCQIRCTSARSQVLLQIPHPLFDGWSLDLILSDLTDIVNNRQPADRPQFRAVAEYHATLVASPDLEVSKEYWCKQLADYLPNPLPNFNGKVIAGTKSASLSSSLATSSARIRDCATAVGCSAQSLLQAALAYLMSSYLGTDDVLFGTVTSGRTVPVMDIENIIGPCIATLPLRVDVSPSKNVKALLQEIHDSNRNMLKHCTLPLREIKRACDMHVEIQLFDILFVWQETLQKTGNDHDRVRLVDSADQLEFKLTLEFGPSLENISVKATYDPAFLPQAQVSLLLEQLSQIVTYFVRSTDCELTGVGQCFDSSVLSIVNANPVIHKIKNGLASAVEDRAKTCPDSPAILFGALLDASSVDMEMITYRELNERANRLARLLQSHHVKPDDLVCVCMEKSIDLYVSILATIKTGAGYLPITPDTPQERINMILEESQVRLCLSHDSSPARLGYREDCVVVMVDNADLNVYFDEDLAVPYRGSDVAYAVFTSGSTGVPKGVLVTHDNTMSNLMVLAEIYPVPDGSRLLQACSQAFDVSVFEIFFAWYTGMCLCAATKDELFRDLEHAIRRMEVTHLSLTPTVAALVDPNNVPSVEFLVTAGEAVTESVLRSWADKGLYQGYGPSETTNICTVKPSVCKSDTINNIGPPLSNTSAFIFRGSGNAPAPKGSVGELCFGGQQVFRGYLNQPELTNAKIIQHPKHGRLYRSGDLGRLLPDGSILFCGRLDDQVKLRGQRVELGEVNAVVLQSSAVHDCVTLVVRSETVVSDRLVVFWVPKGLCTKDLSIVSPDEETRSIIKELSRSLSASLPRYMMPSNLIPVTSIPMTAQGKVDKRELASALSRLATDDLDATSSEAQETDETGEWSDSEKRIAACLAGIVDVHAATVKKHSSFFSLGLDSISAISLSRALKAAVGHQVPVSVILRHPTVARLAGAMSQQPLPNSVSKTRLEGLFKNGTLTRIKACIQPYQDKLQRILPCTPLQEAMLSAGVPKGESKYCNRMLFEVKGDPSRLQDSWMAMIQRHDVLRTCFVPTDEGQFAFAQLVLQAHRPQWEARTFSTPEELETWSGQFAFGAIASLLDMRRPPYGFAALTLGRTSYLLFYCHHVLYDGAAISQLLREVERTYHREKLPPPIDYDLFLEQTVKQRSDAADRFWQRHLKAFEPCSFPELREKTCVCRQSSDQCCIAKFVSNITLNDLKRECQRVSTSVLSATQAAWARTLSFYQSRTDICFGNVVSGRSLPIDGLERLVAPCFNTLPVRVSVNRHRRNVDLMKELQKLNADALEFQLTPLRRIQSKFSNYGRRLFDTLFILQQSAYELDASIWTLKQDVGEMDFPIVCELIPNHVNDTLEVLLHVSHSVICPKDISRISQTFDAALQACLRCPSARTDDYIGFSESLLYKAHASPSEHADTAASASLDVGRRKETTEKCGWSQIEREVRSSLSAVSGIPPICIDRTTTIYQLGLDSISAVQVAARLRDKGFAVTVGDVLERPTCADLAGLLQDQGRASSEPLIEYNFDAFQRTHVDGVCKDYHFSASWVESLRPCTPLQSGMLAQFLQSKGQMYLNYMKYEINPVVTISRLRTAWENTFAKHRILRTGFTQINHENHSFAMVSYLPKASELPWTTCQKSGLTSEDVDYWRTQSAQEIYKSLHRPAWRIMVAESGQASSIHLIMFHALYDAQSLHLVLDDVAAVCAGGRLDSEVPFESALTSILHASADKDEVHQKFWLELGKNVCINRFPVLTPLREGPGQLQTVFKNSTSLRSKLERGCRVANITMQAAGQTAWTRLLAAYTGEESVTFGTVLSGRTTEETRSVCFPCLTTVPTALKNNRSNRALLDAVMQFNASVQRHQFTPLNRIQRWTGHSEEALFDTLFAYQKIGPKENYRELYKLVEEKSTADFAISFEIEQAENDLFLLRLTYKADVLPNEQAVLLLDQLDRVLNDIISHPEETLDHAFMETTSLLSITPAKESVLDSKAQLLHEFVELSACTYSDRVAFEFVTDLHSASPKSRCWTYRELNEEGNKIANMLLGQHVSPGSIVAMCFDKCPEASFAMLGILKAGCAFLAIDTGAPVARKLFIMKDSKAQVLISTEQQTKGLLGQLDVPILCLDILSIQRLSTAQPRLARAIQPDDLSYCLYTSGTTGTPKGCELTHENAVQAMLGFKRLFTGHWDRSSRWLQFASFHFDVSVLEQYWSWAVGIRVVSGPRDMILEDLTSTIRKLEITHIDLTPSLVGILEPHDVPSLSRGVFITGGERLKQEIIDRWGSKRIIYNGYGPTETTIGCTMYPRVPSVGRPANIGRQFDNVGSYVLQPDTEVPVVRGAVGELCISGRLVGKGYLNRPDLTRERFPYLERFGERVYRTGDLVRILYDGSFDFLGRADDQIKLRGQRLETGEINTVIKSEVAKVIDVATLVLTHPAQRKEQLVAFVVSKDTKDRIAESKTSLSIADTCLGSDIRQACQRRLPAYMVPTHIIPLTSMPLSSNNKADTSKLKSLYNDLSVNDLQNLIAKEALDEPWSPVERRFRDILATMPQMHDSNITKFSNIFGLGLDSVSVIGFTTAVKKAGFTAASASMVMQNPTIAALAKALKSLGAEVSRDDRHIYAARQDIAACEHRYRLVLAKSLGIRPGNIESIAPCTPLQQGIISNALERDRPIYFGAFHFELRNHVEIEKLRMAWEKILAAVPILRTHFEPTEDGYIQAALCEIPLKWTECSIPSDLELNDFLQARHRKWWKQNRNDIKKPFEIVVAHSPAKTVLALHLFHALYDGNSLPLLLDSVQAAYNGHAPGKCGASFFEALPYGPLRKTSGAEAFWKARLSGIQLRTLPSLASDGASRDVSITAYMHNPEAFENCRRKLNVAHQALVQACWIAVLQNYLESAVTLGMVVSGRSIDFEDAEGVIGPMFNTVPFHIKFSAAETWESLVKKCHDNNVSTLPYQHTPLRDITRWCGGTPSRPLFDNFFVFQKSPKRTERKDQHQLWHALPSSSEADYPLALEVEHMHDGSLKFILVAAGQIANDMTANDLLQQLQHALSGLMDDINALVSDTVGDGPTSTRVGPRDLSNKVSDAHINGVHHFEWSDVAYSLRDEIAALAGLDPSEVDEHVSILELGLDSIDAIKLSSRMKRHDIQINVTSIMRSLTIGRMAQQLSKESATAAPMDKATGSRTREQQLKKYLAAHKEFPEEYEYVTPATPLQEAIISEMIASGFAHYYNHDVLRIAQSVDMHRLKHAWEAVYKDYPILRTTFRQIEDPAIESAYAQVVHAPTALDWHEIVETEYERIWTVLEDIKHDASELAGTGRLFRLTLVRCPSQTFLILSIAHALYDGWSLSLLHEDVRRAYLGHRIERPLAKRFLEDIMNASGSDAYDFWQDYLSGAASTHVSCHRPSSQSSDVKVHRREIFSITPISKVEYFCKAQGITLQALGQTCWSFVLASRIRKLDVTFGVVVSGRDTEEAAELMFPTMNTVACRTILHGSVSDMLRYVQEDIGKIRQYQHFPLRKAQKFAGPDATGLFDTLFVYQKRPEAPDENDAPLYQSVESLSAVEYPVCIEVETTSTSLMWRIACADGVMSDGDAGEMLQLLDTVLAAVIKAPDAPAIDFRQDGISVCGLPPFENESSRQAPAKNTSQAQREHNFPSASWSNTEKIIRQVLSSVSGTPESEITQEMTMFHMGLDSISAIKVSSLLRRHSIRLSVSEMLQAATIDGMAQIVDSCQAGNTDIASTRVDEKISQILRRVDYAGIVRNAHVEQDSVERIMPASAGQVYMLTTWQKSEGALFFPKFRYRLRGSISSDVLRTAWETTISHNPILRTIYLTTNSKELPIIQVILKRHRDSFVLASPDCNRVTQIMDTDRSGQPLVTLFAQEQEEGWLLTLKIQHALYDAVSLQNLIGQFQELCNDAACPTPSVIAYHELLAATLSEEACANRKAFWTKYLKDVETHYLPQPPSLGTRRTELFNAGVVKTEALEIVARNSGLSVQSVFFAAYARLYAELRRRGRQRGLTDVEDVVLGIYLANRSHSIESIANVAAPTVNLVPLRVKFNPREPTMRIAKRIQDQLKEIGTVENSAVGLWEIEQWTGAKIDSFINFLKLPDAERLQNAGPGIIIEEADGGKLESRAEVVDLSNTSYEEPKELRNNMVKDTFVPSIDIEATVRNGALDVGVFAPADMLTLTAAKNFIVDVKQQLQEVVSEE